MNKSDDLSKLASQIEYINKTAYIQYEPIVHDLCSRVASISEVEYTLDGMIDFCGSDEVLALFKKTCKYYYEIYPEMIAYEVNSYREFWDSQ